MNDELNNVKVKINEYELRLKNAEEKGDKDIILTCLSILVELLKEKNILLSKSLGMMQLI